MRPAANKTKRYYFISVHVSQPDRVRVCGTPQNDFFAQQYREVPLDGKTHQLDFLEGFTVRADVDRLHGTCWLLFSDGSERLAAVLAARDESAREGIRKTLESEQLKIDLPDAPLAVAIRYVEDLPTGVDEGISRAVAGLMTRPDW